MPPPAAAAAFRAASLSSLPLKELNLGGGKTARGDPSPTAAAAAAKDEEEVFWVGSRADKVEEEEETLVEGL